jgi:hypothetical protein
MIEVTPQLTGEEKVRSRTNIDGLLMDAFLRVTLSRTVGWKIAGSAAKKFLGKTLPA